MAEDTETATAETERPSQHIKRSEEPDAAADVEGEIEFKPAEEEPAPPAQRRRRRKAR